MTKDDLERLEKWMGNASFRNANRGWSTLLEEFPPVHESAFVACEILPEMLAELRDHEEWKARISQDHDAYDQGIRDRTAKFVEVLEALRDDQRRKKATALEMARIATAVKVGDGDLAKYHRVAECLRSGEEFCDVLLKMIGEGLL